MNTETVWALTDEQVKAANIAAHQDLLLLQLKEHLRTKYSYTGSLAQLCEDALSYLDETGGADYRSEQTRYTCIALAIAVCSSRSDVPAHLFDGCFSTVFWQKEPSSSRFYGHGEVHSEDRQQARALWLTMLGQYFEAEGL